MSGNDGALSGFDIFYKLKFKKASRLQNGWLLAIALNNLYYSLRPHFSIVLSVIAMNVDRISRSILRLFFDIVFSRCKQYEFMLINIQNNNAENLACC